MDDNADIRPWDRQPQESSKAYEAFVAYRDLGAARSIPKAAQLLGKSATSVSVWSKRWRWLDRTAAWDSIPGRSMQEAYEDLARRIAEQHERVATKLLDRLELGLDQMPPGKTPTQSWTMAHGAARQGHQFVTELSKPASTAAEEIRAQIGALIERLMGEDDE